MRSRLVRVLGLVAGLVAVLAATASSADTPLSVAQIKSQVERRLSKDEALQSVQVSVQEYVVSLSGTVPSLWAKKEAIAEARALEDVESVVSDALEIERAESDLAIGEQIGRQIRRVSIPGPHGPHAGADIEEAIYGHTGNSFYGIFDYVDGRIDDGVVTLTGT